MIAINRRDTLAWRPGMTVEDVLNEMKYRFTLLTVTVNGTVIHPDEFDEHEIPDGADVRIIHLHHGG
jgi:thiamine biosynthesis protein ThiS